MEQFYKDLQKANYHIRKAKYHNDRAYKIAINIKK